MQKASAYYTNKVLKFLKAYKYISNKESSHITMLPYLMIVAIFPFAT